MRKLTIFIPSFCDKEYCGCPKCVAEEVNEAEVSWRTPGAGEEYCALPVLRPDELCITPVVFVRLNVSLRFLYKGTINK